MLIQNSNYRMWRERILYVKRKILNLEEIRATVVVLMQFSFRPAHVLSTSALIVTLVSAGQAQERKPLIAPGTTAISSNASSGASAPDTFDPTEDFPLATPVEAVEGTPVPLTVKGKTDYFLKSAFSSQSMARMAATTAFGQATGGRFGGGVDGYTQSLASRYAEHLTSRTIQYGVGALLREDPRFYRSGKDGFWERTAFVLSRTVVTKKDDGSTTIAAGRLLGTFGSNALSAYWHPARPDPLTRGLSETGVNLAGDVGIRMVREFWPDIKRLFKK